MLTLKDWAVDCAVLTFAKERPCGIYKQDYLGDLFERYGDLDDCLEVGICPVFIGFKGEIVLKAKVW